MICRRNRVLFGVVWSIFVLFCSFRAVSVHAAPIDETEPNDTQQSAQALTIIGAESPVEARMNATDDVDWFSFEAVAGQSYIVETFNVAGAVNTRGYALQLRVFDVNGTVVKEDTGSQSNGAGNTNSGVSIGPTQSGRYFIQVYHYNSYRGTGPYSLRILPKFNQANTYWDENEEPNNWAFHSYELQIGRSHAVSSTIEQRNSSYITERPDRDWFRFEAIKDQFYSVETFNVAGAVNSRGYALQLQIFDSDFTNVAEDIGSQSNGAGNTNARVSFQATKGGVYYIRIGPYDSYAGSGPYSIQVLPTFEQADAAWDTKHEPNNWHRHGFPLAIGREQAITSSIERRNSSYLTERADRDWFIFNAEQGKQYVVEIFNAAGAINSRDYAMQLAVRDSDFTLVAEDTSSRSSAPGNVSASVNFDATKGGTYYIYVAPYESYAGSGPYSIRVLPHYNEPEASWDAAFEPNNYGTNAFLLPDVSCGRLTTIEPRNNSYLTNTPDRDWFRFELTEGQEYSLDLFEVSGRFAPYGLVLQLYDREFSKLHEVRNMDIRYIFTAGYTGLYFARINPYQDKNGTYRIRVVPTDGPPCDGRPLPRARVEGCASIGINNETGEVTLRGTPRRGCNQTISRIVQCTDGATPQDVTLTIGGNSFAMTSSGGNRYSVTIDTGSDLPDGNGPFSITETHTCNLNSSTTIVGSVVLFDPSGVITDAQSGEPIPDATVTLHQVPDALPDKDGQTNDCRTVETRSGGSWDNLPAANVVDEQSVDPVLDAINNTVRIDPAVNPQVTGTDGSYAWDVIEGCWYITIEAPGYQSRISPLVGVPPEVTDLDMQLQRAERRLYLPHVQR